MGSIDFHMDKVTVTGLKFHAKHGCHAEERRSGGPFEVDVVVFGDFSEASQKDDIHAAVDYVAIMELASAVMAKPKNLIETVCNDLANKVLDSFPLVQRAEVTIRKMQPPVPYHLEYVSASTSVERTPN